jgi:hypothetical protein
MELSHDWIERDAAGRSGIGLRRFFSLDLQGFEFRSIT